MVKLSTPEIVVEAKAWLGERAVIMSPSRLPAPPVGLIDAIKARNAIAVIGSGLSAAGGGPSWNELIRGLAFEALQTQPLRAPRIAAALLALKIGRPLDAASILKEALGKEFAGAVSRQLGVRQELEVDETILDAAARGDASGTLIGQKRAAEPRAMAPTAAHRMLSRMGFRAVISTNYDLLIEQSWEQPASIPVHSWSSVQLEGRVQSGEPFLLKVHGDINYPDDIVLAREDYIVAARNTSARNAVRTLMKGGTPFWLGYGHNDPDLDLLWDESNAWFQLRGYSIAMAQDDLLQTRLRASGITYSVLNEHSDYVRFLRSLAEALDVQIVFEVKTRASPASPQEVDDQGSEFEATFRKATKSAIAFWKYDPRQEAYLFESKSTHLAALKAWWRSGGAASVPQLFSLDDLTLPEDRLTNQAPGLCSDRPEARASTPPSSRQAGQAIPSEASRPRVPATQIFMSRSWQEKGKRVLAISKLRASGYGVLNEQREACSTEELNKQVLVAMDQAHVIVAFLTNETLSLPALREELTRAQPAHADLRTCREISGSSATLVRASIGRIRRRGNVRRGVRSLRRRVDGPATRGLRDGRTRSATISRALPGLEARTPRHGDAALAARPGA